MAAFLLWMSVVLDASVLAGLVARGRWRQVYLLPAVVLAFLTSASIVGLCPRCNTWEFWLTKEFVHVTLTLLVGVELSVRLFPRSSPGLRHARVCVGLVVVAIALIMLTTPAGVDVLPRLAATVILLYAGLTLVMAGHDVVLTTPLHEVLLYSFPLYFIVYVATWGFTGDDTRLANLASPLAFNLLMLNVTRVVWRRDDHYEEPVTLRARVRRLLR